MPLSAYIPGRRASWTCSGRASVELAITTLGRGFLAHPGNGVLREALRSGQLSTKGYYGEVLRLVYRLIFLFAAEDRLTEDYRFFHWHLAFPLVFSAQRGARNTVTGWHGGFDVMLGNPPWERIKLQEKEFFAERRPEIAEAPNAAARKRAIARLQVEEPRLWAEWQAALRASEAESALVRDGGAYPLCGRGDVNTYSLFAELNRSIVSPSGRAGFIVPSGIATDATTQLYFQALVSGGELAALYHFENEALVFPGVHHATRFVLLTLDACGERTADLVFYARSTRDLQDVGRHVALSASDFALLNPNTMTCPTFRSRRDAEITKAVYRRVPVLWREGDPEGNPWGLSFLAMLHMANDSELFMTRPQLEAEGWRLEGNVFLRNGERCLPLYEAKMVHHFDHRFGTYEGQTEALARQGKLPEFTTDDHAQPTRHTLPRYWVPQHEVAARLDGVWSRGWVLGWRDICRSTDSRTVIAAFVPRVGLGHTSPLVLSQQAPRAMAALGALLRLQDKQVRRPSARRSGPERSPRSHDGMILNLLAPRAESWLSYDEIEDQTGLAREQIQKAVSRLVSRVAHGAVERRTERGRRQIRLRTRPSR